MSVFIYALFPSEDFAENAASMIHERVSPIHALHISTQEQEEEDGPDFLPLIPVNNLANGYTSTPGLSPGIFAMNTGLLAFPYDGGSYQLPFEETEQSSEDRAAKLSVCCEEQDRFVVESICVAMGGSLDHSH